ncbi:MAG TPA: glycoside hydrolase family 3 N-terminal domain-containing protein [Gaiellaceae bacterium]|nr:glycoside hydrolase family 3 N-terminal domain-containing protein [Gaiellaceae bacterium]
MPAGAGNDPTVRQMVGQLMLVRMQGQTPTPSFLARIRRGEIGGVVLFSDNFDARGPSSIVSELQAAATSGHQPPLLIAVDQEGGIVKRLPGAPSLAPPAMSTASSADEQGLDTARNLRRFGINLDLAPVLDVGRGGFITPRTFGSSPRAVATRGPAFAVGLARGHVLATAKHFPGLGYATLNTDSTVVKVTATEEQIRGDWLPFATAIRKRIPVIMMSTAIYPALGSTRPAALSPNIVGDLRRLGFTGVIATDALKTPAVTGLMSTTRAAVEAVEAGDDLVLAAGPSSNRQNTDGVSIPAFNALVAAANDGSLPRSTLSAAYARVLELKRAP